MMNVPDLYDATNSVVFLKIQHADQPANRAMVREIANRLGMLVVALEAGEGNPEEMMLVEGPGPRQPADLDTDDSDLETIVPRQQLLKEAALWDKLQRLIREHARWSQETFGHDDLRGPIGPLSHLEKEIHEIKDAVAEDFSEEKVGLEFADAFLLFLDASRRAGYSFEDIMNYSHRKMRINKHRKWPTPTSDAPVEHIRNGQTDRT